jgi:hypothetical protein
MLGVVDVGVAEVDEDGSDRRRRRRRARRERRCGHDEQGQDQSAARRCCPRPGQPSRQGRSERASKRADPKASRGLSGISPKGQAGGRALAPLEKRLNPYPRGHPRPVLLGGRRCRESTSSSLTRFLGCVVRRARAVTQPFCAIGLPSTHGTPSVRLRSGQPRAAGMVRDGSTRKGHLTVRR